MSPPCTLIFYVIFIACHQNVNANYITPNPNLFNSKPGRFITLTLTFTLEIEPIHLLLTTCLPQVVIRMQMKTTLLKILASSIPKQEGKCIFYKFNTTVAFTLDIKTFHLLLIICLPVALGQLLHEPALKASFPKGIQSHEGKFTSYYINTSFHARLTCFSSTLKLKTFHHYTCKQNVDENYMTQDTNLFKSKPS